MASVKTYTIGFVLSVVLTLIAYMAVVNHWTTGAALIAVIIGLAVVQLVVQLVFFLHMGRESKPQWNLISFIFMVFFLVVVVAGSLWVMASLNYNMMMTPEQMDEYMLKQGSKGF